MAQGESRRLQYRPGEARQGSDVLEAGDYNFSMTERGEPGFEGWTVKQGKYPNRKLTFSALDTQNPITGEEMQLTTYLSLSPGGLEYGVLPLAAAAGYDGEMDLAVPRNEKDACNRENAGVVDDLLQWIEDRGVILRGRVKTEEYQGRVKAALAFWHPPTEVEGNEQAAPAEESEPEQAGAPDEGEVLPPKNSTGKNGSAGLQKSSAKPAAARPRAAPRATR